MESIKDLIIACYEENSFITGIPIYLIKPEVFSAKATAEETQDGINQATITDRIKTERVIEDLLSKIAAKENQINSRKLEPNSISVSLPPNSLAQMKMLATTLSGLVRDQSLTPETLWDLIPEVDSDQEKERWQKWYGNGKTEGNSEFMEKLISGESTPTDKIEEPIDIELEAKARLKGTVGGVNGILEIQRAVSAGTADYQSAISMLDLIYGFSNDEAKRILGTPKKIKQTEAAI